MHDRGDIRRAEQKVKDLNRQVKDLESDCATAVDTVRARYAPDAMEITETLQKPRKSDITLSWFGLVWQPWVVDENGIAERA